MVKFSTCYLRPLQSSLNIETSTKSYTFAAPDDLGKLPLGYHTSLRQEGHLPFSSFSNREVKEGKKTL